jgi:4-oxalocrotonate tautomerase
MPFVNIKITKEGATPEQKAELIKGVTDLLVNVLHKNPQAAVVVIEEVDLDNWGIGGGASNGRFEKFMGRKGWGGTSPALPLKKHENNGGCVLRTPKWRVRRALRLHRLEAGATNLFYS